jgi:hypothetical protein
MVATFFPAADAALSLPGVVLLPVDSGEEGEYLLNALALRYTDLGIKVQDWVVDSADPFHFWAGFTGSAEDPGWSPTSPDELWLIHGGEFIPATAALTHLRELHRLTWIARAATILPVFRSQLPIFESLKDPPLQPAPKWFSRVYKRLFGLMGCVTRLDVPTLADADLQRIETLTRALVHSRVPGFAASALSGNADELVRRLVAAKPVSRSQLERWVDLFVQDDNPASAPANCDRRFVNDLPHQPVLIPTRRELREQFTIACERLKAAGSDFESDTGEPLFFPHQTLKDPFTSPEPHDWFFGLVSYISCIVFDAGKTRLDILAKFTYDPTTGDFRGEPACSLLNYLRPMRTAFQHAVHITGNARNDHNLKLVESWYYKQCGSQAPCLTQYRRLTAALVSDWAAFVDGIANVIANLHRAPSALVVRNELALASRSIEQGELLAMIDRAAELAGTTIDAEAFRKKHEHALKSALKSSALTGKELKAFANTWVEDKVINEVRRCPADGDWLNAQGVPSGPELGDWLKRLHAEWERAAPGTAAEEFLADAASRIKEHQQKKKTNQ